MEKITWQEYLSLPEDYRGIRTTERRGIPGREEIRGRHMGKRTMTVYDNGTCLPAEGVRFERTGDVKGPAGKEARL